MKRATVAAMITSVSTWRCKCGVRVKVVAEVDHDTPTATVIAACPNCKDRQVVYARRIVEVSHEKGDTSIIYPQTLGNS